MGNSDLGRNLTPGYEAQLGDSEQGSFPCTVKEHRDSDRSLSNTILHLALGHLGVVPLWS